MSNNLVTILIPTYNRIDLLKKAYNSCKNQTFKNFDLIITDNGSTDGTREFLNEVNKENIITDLILHDSNLGATANVLNALKFVKTKWLTILCDDDFLENDFLQESINILKSTKSGLVITGFNTVDENGNVTNMVSPLSQSLDRNQYINSFLNGTLQTAGVSGFFFILDVLDKNEPIKNYPRGFLTDTMMCVESGIFNGCEVIGKPIYNRLLWSGSESAFSIDNLKLYFHGLLLFQKDLEIISLDKELINKSMERISKAQPLSQFFRIIILKIAISGFMKYKDLEDFKEIAKIDLKYKPHMILMTLFYPLLTRHTFWLRQIIFKTLRKIKRAIK